MTVSYGSALIDLSTRDSRAALRGVEAVDAHGGREPLSVFWSRSLFSAGGMVAGGLLSLVTGVVFARWLTPGGFGTYSLVLISMAVAGGIGTFGFDNCTARFAALYLGNGETYRIRGLIRHGIARALLFSSVIGIGLFALLRAGILERTRLAQVTHFSMLLLVGIPLYALQLVLLQAVLGLQGVRTRILLEKIVQPVCRLALPFALLAWLAEPTAAAVYSLLATSLVLDVASALLLSHKLRGLPAISATNPEEKRQWLRYALPFVFYSIQNFFWAGMGLDVFLVGAMTSMRDAGIYAAALRLVPILALARGAMDYSFGPRVGVLFGQSDLKAIGKLYRNTSTLALAWTLPVAVILAVFGRTIMRSFFGGGYEAGGMALAFLAAGFVVDSATGCNTTLLSMAGRSGLVLLNGVTGGTTLLFLAWVLIPRWGIAGAGFATACSMSVVNSMATLEIWETYRLSPFGRTPIKLLGVGLGVAAFGVLWRIAVLPLIGPGTASLAVSASVIVFAYLVLVLAVTGSFRALFIAEDGQATCQGPHVSSGF